MAAKITVDHPEEVTRQDTLRVNPDDVVILPGTNARNPDGKSEAVDYAEQVKARALSIYTNGQLQPAGVRRTEDHKLVLTFGFTRRDAVALLRTGFEAIDPRDGETHFIHKPDATLWVKVDDCDVKEAFLRSIAENQERNDTTDYQQAKAQATLRETYGYTDAAIARTYGYTNQNRVAALRKLLELPEKRQLQVHRGELALYTAFEVSKIKDEAEREAILDGALVNGKIDGSKVKELLREATAKAAADTLDAAEQAGDIVILEDAVPKKAKRGAAEPNIKRSVSDLRKFIAEVLDDTTKAKPKVKELFATLGKWIDGGCQDKSLWNRINEF